MLYFVPSSNWKSDNARFAAYYYSDNANEWVSMTKNADGRYEALYKEGYTGVIFVRMDPTEPQNNWDNKWNQSTNLTLSSDNNCFTVTSTDWNIVDGNWSNIKQS